MASAQGRAIPPENLTMFQRQKLNDLIAFQLLLAKATDADKAKGKELFQKALKRLKTDNKLTDAEFDEKLSSQLRLQGLTRAEWDKQRLDQATVGAVLQRELKIEVTDADAKKYYDENPTKFEQPEQVRASHILIGTKDQVTGSDLSDEQKKAKLKQIQDLRKRVMQGEDFAKLAKEFSEDPGSKDIGGEYTFGRGRMVPAFEAAAFSLNTNQVSDVVTTDYGYHIIKLSEKIPAKVITYAEVSDDLKEALRTQALQKQLEDGKYLASLRKEANVEILDEKLKKLEETMSQNEALMATPDAKK
jgi:peptidyl-prolyl cis-trans isomerase C